MNTVDWIGFGSNLLIAGMAIMVTVGITMAVAFVIENHSIIDIVWGPGFVVVAAVSYVASTESPNADPTRRGVMLALVTMWGLRLGWHIARRNRGHVDPRYVKMLQHNDGSVLGFVVTKIYGPQAIAMWVVSLPVQFAMYESSRMSVLNLFGVGVWLVGLGFEAIGDMQLARFKKDPANEGKVLDHGLWGWTRHPNYFGDSLVWWGLWLVSLGAWSGLLTIVSPALMTWLLINVTGARLTDKMMARRRGADFDQYVARVPAFLPRPPRTRQSEGPIV